MEPKKNLKADIHRYRSLFLTFGYAIALALFIYVFKIGYQPKAVIIEPEFQISYASNYPDEVKMVRYKTESADKSRTLKTSTATNIIAVASAGPETKIDIDQLEPNFGTEPGIVVDSIVIEPNEEDNTIHYSGVVEKQPEPVGGYEGFYKFLKNNLKYSKQARRLELEGKVYIEFVVDKTGKVVNARVLKGIGEECDKEALRVVQLTQWNPGKQRGRPVNVKMVVPVQYKLSH